MCILCNGSLSDDIKELHLIACSNTSFTPPNKKEECGLRKIIFQIEINKTELIKTTSSFNQSLSPTSTPMSSVTSSFTPYFSCILARDLVNGGIGCSNSLPWKLKDDIKHFKTVTTFNTEYKENILIMGRRTWESMGGKPLPKRICIVVSTTLDTIEGGFVENSLDNALQKATSFGRGRYIFVIGGVSLYKEAFKHPLLETIYETRVTMFPDVTYDTFFNDLISSDFEKVSSKTIYDGTSNLNFVQYNKFRYTPEKGYFDLVNEIISKGEARGDRTGTGTISVFGPQARFDIREYFPLISTKTVGLKTVFEELIWMLRGQTNNNTLKRKKVHIWTKNSDDHHKKIITRGGDDHVDGDMGPLYGYQWRSFGGDYVPVSLPENATEEEKIIIEDKRRIGEGFDQIQYVIDEIRNNPESRRIMFSAWNPVAIGDMALPPCHIVCEFYVSQEKYLHCKLFMRSNDVFLGAPFNIAQYSLLTYMIAAMTGYTPGDLIYSLGDAHIYSNHIEQMKTQLLRPLRELPRLNVCRVPEKIEDFEFTDFKLTGNCPHPSIKGDMAV